MHRGAGVAAVGDANFKSNVNRPDYGHAGSSSSEPAATATASPDPLAEKVWDTAVMLAEELSPRESATDEELRAAEYLADRFSGWGYEVGLQDFEAVEIGRANRLVVLGPGDAVAGLSRLGYREGDRVWMFAFPVDPSSLAADGYEVEGANGVRGSGHGRGLRGGRPEGQDRTDRGGWGGIAEGEGGGRGGGRSGSGGDIQ